MVVLLQHQAIPSNYRDEGGHVITDPPQQGLHVDMTAFSDLSEHGETIFGHEWPHDVLKRPNLDNLSMLSSIIYNDIRKV